jgi:hypothetical protein
MNKKLFLWPLLFSTISFAAVDWTFLGSFNFSKPSVNYNYIPAPTTMKYSFGGGATLGIGGFSALKIVKFEIGLFYASRRYMVNYLGTDTDFLFSFFEMPLNVRFKLSRFFSIGGGGYVALGFGKFSTFAPSGPGSLQVDYNYSDYNFSPFDAGLHVNFMIHIPVGPMASIVADFRSSYGLINIDNTATNNLHFSNLTAFVGVRLGEVEQTQ